MTTKTLDNHWNGEGVLEFVPDHNGLVKDGYKIEFYNLYTWEQCQRGLWSNSVFHFKKPTKGKALYVNHPRDISTNHETAVVVRPSNRKSTDGKRLYVWEYVSKKLSGE